MDNARVLLKELKDVAKEVGVLDKSTKLRCAFRAALGAPSAAPQPRAAPNAAAVRASAPHAPACGNASRLCGCYSVRLTRLRLLGACCRGARSDLIKQVRQCKTAAEERALIAKESAAMRAEFREQARAASRVWRSGHAALAPTSAPRGRKP
jgi:hypothetical protein